MSISKLVFSKDWNNPIDFPTIETSEAQVRADIQLLYDELRDKINEVIAGAEDGSLGTVSSDDIKGFRIGEDGSLEVSTDGETFTKIPISGQGFTGLKINGHILAYTTDGTTWKPVGPTMVDRDATTFGAPEMLVLKNSKITKLPGTGNYYFITHPELISRSVELDAGLWESAPGFFRQYVDVDEVGANNMVIVTPDPSDANEYAEAGVICVEQTEGLLEFHSSSPVGVKVNIAIWTE